MFSELVRLNYVGYLMINGLQNNPDFERAASLQVNISKRIGKFLIS